MSDQVMDQAKPATGAVSDPAAQEDEIFVFPASFAQQRLWFLDQFEPNSPFYNLPNAIRFGGRLDLTALGRCLNEIVARHETLRTTFAVHGGELVQVVAPSGSLPLPVTDLTHLPENAREAEARRLAREEARQPFDLSKGPLIRGRLLKLAADDHVLFLTMHHIISDGWSMGVLVSELSALYAAFSTGRPSPLPDLPIQYADFAQWQRQWLQGAVLEEQLAYWKKQIGRHPPVLELPTFRPRPTVQTYRGATMSTDIDRGTTEALKALGLQQGATLFMTLLAAFYTLLYRYTDQDDICIGTPIANRNRAEIESLIGFFVNTLVLRSDLSGNPTFRELVGRVREVTLQAYAHQDLPFEMLVEALQPERDMSHSTFFQVMFILQNASARVTELPGLTLSSLEAETGTATFDLTLMMGEHTDGMEVSVEYNTDLFDAPAISRLLGHFTTLLRSIARNPDESISRLAMLTIAERDQLLEAWNATRSDFSQSNATIQELFEAQVERTPQEIALVWPGILGEDPGRASLSYLDLNARANQLAHYLVKLGVGVDVPVGICVERSPEMVVAVLGVLKAGAAYLPLDPNYPADRLAYMLDDSGVTILLTQASLQAGLAGKLPPKLVHVVPLDADWPVIACESQKNPARLANAENLAYLIYTSGSTGRPKGVQVTQRSLVNAYLAWEDSFRLRAIHSPDNPGVHLQMANFAFDVFSGDLVRALCSGGRLVLCPREVLLEAEQLYQLMQQEAVDCAEFVPAVLRGLAQYLEETRQDLVFMRLLICGSDVWHVEEYRRFLRLCGPDTRLINSYGLTEATIDSCCYEDRDIDLPADRIVPIGRPFANTQMYVLDKERQPQPIGVPGELYVGGRGLAKGYWNLPDATREAFVPHPFAGEPGERLYKTGDLARFLPDGNLEYLGRADYQLKIRGYRIEPGEIESVLKGHPAIRDAVVVAATPPGGNAHENAAAQRLVAYLVADLPVERVPLQGRVLAANLDRANDLQADQESLELRALDFSYHGICLGDVPAAWDVGQRVRLSLELPGWTDGEFIPGRVVWHDGKNAGVALDPPPEQKLLLHRNVKQMVEKSDLLLADLRQQELRIAVRGTALIEFGAGERQEIPVENLSHRGVRLNGGDGWRRVGQRIRLCLQVPELPGEIWLRGYVRWSQATRAWVQFETGPVEREWLDESLEAIIRARTFTYAQLRTSLKSRLAEYMLPAIFVLLDALPLTPNGKVDRTALPDPDWSRLESEREYLAPRTSVEARMAAVWAEVLGIDKVGARDNFFELGGHSLLATQLISRLRKAFQVDLPLRSVFEAPTVEGLAESVEIARRAEESAQLQPILPAPRDRDLPLSFAQQRLWFLDQLEPGSPFYNLPEATHLLGPLDLQVFERSLNEVVRRHAILRTTFPTEDGKPRQVIHDSMPVTMRLDDLSHLPKETRLREANRLARREAQQPFDLGRGPLLRARLLRLGEEDHVVLLTMHHILGDDWSTQVLVNEVAIIYDAFAHGLPSPLPELPIQYADFAYWQRGWLQGEVLQAQLDYWQGQLGGSPPLLELPTDRPRPAVQSYQGSYQTFSLSSRLTTALHDLCQREGVTPFMLLLAAFEVLLYRYSGQEDFNVGTPIANRNRADIENLIGFFVNTLVLRTDVSGEPSFRQFLQRVRETALGAYAHQDLPFEMIVDALQPVRDLSHSPLFQVMFVIQNAPIGAQELPNLSLEAMDVHSGTAKFDLTLFMLEENDRFGGALEYNTDLFDTATMARMLRHFQTLLESIVDDPDLSVAQLEMLSPEERHRLLVEWNDTAADYPAGSCAHQLFEAQVDRTPGQVAVACWPPKGTSGGEPDLALTYLELDQRANQLAHYLQKLGVGPDVLVGLCIERSPELLVGMLGILKAGGAYVPLDPAYPPERLAFMLSDAAQTPTGGRPVLVTQRSLRQRLGDVLGEGPVICLDEDWHAISSGPVVPPTCATGPQNLAYVIYTSGSTGKPKGTMIRHHGLVNYLSWCRRAYPLAEGQGSPVHSSISFDLTVTSLFSPLMAGRRVLLLPEGAGPEVLGEVLRSEANFSLVKITPAHLQILGELLEPEDAAGRTLAFIIGGENLLVEHIDFWQTHAPHTALVNEYGPTETVVGCCVYWAPPGKHQRGVVPIGRPIINTQHYILDRHLQPVPVGVRGELFIGGAGVARGYHNRPELTAERFIPNPFSDDPHDLLYRTGDLVRYLPDGTIECLGRIDFQVKVRGFRVELGEIEAVLGEHPQVSECVVWVWEEQHHKRLVAYVVPEDPEDPPAAEALRAHLEPVLPEYMLPAAYVFLEALPLTANGKVDRQALPAPELLAAGLKEDHVPPRTPQEQILARIWAQVLGMEMGASDESDAPLTAIGVHDNFFELGGDSILAIQVIARAGRAGLQLTPRQLFEHPTIAGLVAVAGGARLVQAEQGLVTGAAALTPIQHWFFAQQQPEPGHWNQSVLVEIDMPLNHSALEGAFRSLLEQHDALRLAFDQTPQGWEQIYQPLPAEVPLRWVDLGEQDSLSQRREIEAICAQEQASLDLGSGCLLKATYFDLGSGEPARLLLIVHHLAMDGVSWGILLEDLQAAYQAIAQDQPALLPPKTSSYRQWSDRLAEFAQTDAVQDSLDYWTPQPDDPLSFLSETPLEANLEGSTTSLALALSAAETDALLHKAPAAYQCEINDVLLAALGAAWRELSGESPVWIDLESYGRQPLFDDIDLSRTVGWFTALYPLRLEIDGGWNPAELVGAVRDQLRRIPQGGLGYGALRYLHPDLKLRQRLAALPTPPVSFNYLGQLDAQLDPGGVFRMASEDRGPERSPLGRRPHLLEIDGGVAGGRLQLEWSYSPDCLEPDLVAGLVNAFGDHLRAIIAGCQEVQEGPRVVEDHDDFGWSQDDLEDILGAIDRRLPGDEHGEQHGS